MSGARPSGLEYARDELAHAFEPFPAGGRRILAVLPKHQIAGQKCFEHEPVIRGRLLEVHAVWRGLLEDLLFDDGAADREPGAGRARAPEEAAEKHQADSVAQVMVAVEIGLFEVLDDEVAVKKQGAQEPAPECFVATRAPIPRKNRSPRSS